MTDIVPTVEARGEAVAATIVLTDGIHVHARLHPDDLVNGGVMLVLRQVEKAHRGRDQVSIHEALSIDEKHLQDADRIWLPGHRVAAVIFGVPPRSRRPVGFA